MNPDRPERTPRRSRPALAALLVVLLAAVPAAAQFTCRAEVNRHSVPSGEEVKLVVSASGNVGWSPEFVLPELPGVRVFGGGTSQRMSTVNGKAETAVSRTYFLHVDTEKDFTIGPVVIRGNGAECSTEPLDIAVTARAAIPPAQTGNRVPAPRPRETAPVTGTGVGGDVFVTLDVDQADVWLGQQVILTFRYWKRVQPWSNPSYKPPRTEGFWREELGAERNYRRVFEGRAYNVTEINYALFPTRPGTLVIEPAELTFPEDLFDRFFTNRQQRRGPRLLRTDPVTVRVRELPRPQPAGFSGLVATHVDLTSAVDRDTVPRGEAVGLTLELAADGFLKGFRGLDLEEVPGARVHDSAESYESGASGQRLEGRVSVEKVIVPDEEGFLRVPQVEVPWFDVGRGTYRTARTPWRDLVVTPSDKPLNRGEDSGFLRNEIARLSEDLAFIHPVPGSVSARTRPFTGTTLWWTLALLPPLALLVLRSQLGRWTAVRRNPALRRRRGALAAARTLLDEAAAAGGEERAALVSRAVAGYVADRLDLPAAAIDRTEIERLAGACGREDLGESLAAVLHDSALARFGGVGAAETADPESVAGLLAELDGRETEGGGTGLARTVVGLSLLILGVAGAGAAAAERPGADPLRLLAEGNQAYTEGRIDDAVDLYEGARARGAGSAVLHYNLGNAYARNGQLGRAVASYLRAERLAPADSDIAANLSWVRGHLQDLELSDAELPLFIAQAVAVVGLLTLDQWGVLTLVALWLLAAVIGWGWWRDGFTTRMRQAALGLAGAAAVLAVVTAVLWHSQQVRRQAVVVAEEASVRSGPAEHLPVLFEVHDGLTLEVEESREGWVRVGLGGDWGGWLPADAVEEVRRDFAAGQPDGL